MDLNLGFDTVCQAESGSGPGQAGGGGSDSGPGTAERGIAPSKHPPWARGGGTLLQNASGAGIAQTG